MSRKVKLTILGCGNSAGVPEIGNYWGACDPNEPRNRRTRASIALQDEKTTFIVDTGPDFRDQLNRENITHVDGIFYTHAHSDHIGGIDELRVFSKRTKSMIPLYGDQKTIDEIRYRFEYMFNDIDDGLYPAVCSTHAFHDHEYGQIKHFGTIPAIPFVQDHGFRESLGIRVGDLAYSTDMVNLNDAALETLKGVRVWIADAAGYKMPKNYVHATLEQIFKLNETIRAEQVYITHMAAFMDYKTLCDELPSGYAPAYDGLTLETTVD